MTDEQAKAEDGQEKPVSDVQKNELPETELEAVVGGVLKIGSGSGGGGAGKITFVPG
jgi:hypothetical protein